MSSSPAAVTGVKVGENLAVFTLEDVSDVRVVVLLGRVVDVLAAFTVLSVAESNMELLYITVG